MTTRSKKEVPDPRQVLALRERQSVAASVIAEHFGPFMEMHPELWAHRTFLLIVGKVYEYLVLCDEISSKEFVELTKALVESCKSDARREPAENGMDQRSGLGGAIDGLEQIVRQIYGTNLQSGEAIQPPSAPEITKPN